MCICGCGCVDFFFLFFATKKKPTFHLQHEHTFFMWKFSLAKLFKSGCDNGMGLFFMNTKNRCFIQWQYTFFLDSIQFLGSAPWNTDTTTFLFSSYIFRIQSYGVQTQAHTHSQSIILNVILAGVRVLQLCVVSERVCEKLRLLKWLLKVNKKSPVKWTSRISKLHDQIYAI